MCLCSHPAQCWVLWHSRGETRNTYGPSFPDTLSQVGIQDADEAHPRNSNRLSTIMPMLLCTNKCYGIGRPSWLPEGQTCNVPSLQKVMRVREAKRLVRGHTDSWERAGTPGPFPRIRFTILIGSLGPTILSLPGPSHAPLSIKISSQPERWLGLKGTFRGSPVTQQQRPE